jgi:hypothetical protein
MTTALIDQILGSTTLDNRRDMINSIKALLGVIVALVIAVILITLLLHQVDSITNELFSNLMPTSGTSHPSSQ